MTIEYDATLEQQDNAFSEALDFVYHHLKRLISRYEYVLECKDQVKTAMSKYSECLIFEHSLPWLENFFDLDGERHPAQFVIMPAVDFWKLRAIPPSLKERMKVRCAIPKKWAGLHDEELQKITGINGAIFAHKGQFISIWETKEDAVTAWKQVMENRKK